MSGGALVPERHGEVARVNDINRRPLKSRQSALADAAARWLSIRGVSPNQISLASVGFAAFSAVCILQIPIRNGVAAVVLALVAAIGIQARLICNLLDGLVAIEGGKRTPAGELFNDIPDRIADPLILVAAGYATTFGPPGTGVGLGWLAGLLAVMTAYVRILLSREGAPVDFCGPMAKQHRMAVMTVACLVSAFEAGFIRDGFQGIGLWTALALVVVGCVVTLVRRLRNGYRFLENSESN